MAKNNGSRFIKNEAEKNDNVFGGNVKKEIIELYIIDDLSLLKLQKGNRDLRANNLKHLKKSTEEELKENPNFMHTIEVNELGEILDGQHRWKISQELNIPVKVRVVKGGDLKYTQKLNTNKLNWNTEDLVKSVVDTTPELEYIKEVAKICNTTVFNAVKTLASIKTAKQVGYKMDLLRHYTLEETLPRAMEILKVARLITGDTMEKSGSMEVMKVAKSILESEMDLDLLEKKLDGRVIRKSNNEKHMRKELMDIYNYKSKGNYVELSGVSKYDIFRSDGKDKELKGQQVLKNLPTEQKETEEEQKEEKSQV